MENYKTRKKEKKKKNNLLSRGKESNNPYSGTSHLLKLSDRKLKMTLVNILMTLVEKVDKTHEQMEKF